MTDRRKHHQSADIVLIVESVAQRDGAAETLADDHRPFNAGRFHRRMDELGLRRETPAVAAAR